MASLYQIIATGTVDELEYHLTTQEKAEVVAFQTGYSKFTPLMYCLDMFGWWNPNGLGRTPILRQMAMTLLRHGSPHVDTPNQWGQTPIHLAVIHDQFEIVMALCQGGSLSLTVQDDHGNTPLHLAATFGLIEIFEYLCGIHPQELNKFNHLGHNVLHEAAFNNSFGCLNIALRYRSDLINVADNQGWTILMILVGDFWTKIPSLISQWKEQIYVLRAMGVSTPPEDFLAKISVQCPTLVSCMTTTIPEDVRVSIRYQIIFSHSLLSTLLPLC